MDLRMIAWFRTLRPATTATLLCWKKLLYLELPTNSRNSSGNITIYLLSSNNGSNEKWRATALTFDNLRVVTATISATMYHIIFWGRWKQLHHKNMNLVGIWRVSSQFEAITCAKRGRVQSSICLFLMDFNEKSSSRYKEEGSIYEWIIHSIGKDQQSSCKNYFGG